MKKLYLLDHKIKWKTFKKLNDRIVKDSGPTPQNIDRILWKMLRKKEIYCGFKDDLPEDMWIDIELPVNDYEVSIIRNKK